MDITSLIKAGKICPICGKGKLRLAKKYGRYNLASEKVIECPKCYSTFPVPKSKKGK